MKNIYARQPYEPPKTQGELPKGTVFRFITRTADKRVFYIPPKDMHQPTMVKGEKPVEAIPQRDHWLVEILWKPPS